MERIMKSGAYAARGANCNMTSQIGVPPHDPENIDVKSIPKTFPANRAGIARLRGKMLTVMEDAFVKLNELVPEKPSKLATRTATDDRKVMEQAEDLVRTLSRAQQVVAACDQFLKAPGAKVETADPVVP